GGLGDAADGDGAGVAVRGVVVGARGVADGAVGQEGDRAVAALGHAAERGGALEIVRGGAVGAGEHVGGEHGVFVGGQRVVGDIEIGRAAGREGGGLGDVACGGGVG